MRRRLTPWDTMERTIAKLSSESTEIPLPWSTLLSNALQTMCSQTRRFVSGRRQWR